MHLFKNALQGNIRVKIDHATCKMKYMSFVIINHLAEDNGIFIILKCIYIYNNSNELS